MKSLTFALAVLLASPALADLPPVNMTVTSGVLQGTLCSAQTATATGCTSGGDELVADLRGYADITLDGTESTSSTWTCDLYTSINGYDGDSGVGQDRTTISLSNTQQTIGLTDAGWTKAWIECSAIDTAGSTSVTIKFTARK